MKFSNSYWYRGAIIALYISLPILFLMAIINFNHILFELNQNLANILSPIVIILSLTQYVALIFGFGVGLGATNHSELIIGLIIGYFLSLIVSILTGMLIGAIYGKIKNPGKIDNQ
ncbi:MAG: hypothetical protein AABW71_00700 [Nanoarchaeota archaeon]